MPTSPPDPGPGPAGLVRRWGFSGSGWRDNRRGEWWLAAQLVLIAALVLLPAWPAPAALGLTWPLALRGLAAALLVLFLLRALLALRDLGTSLTPLPEPMPGAPLVQQGAYAHCRHPLYQALLGGGLALALLRGSLLHLALGLALAGVLGGKARREERSLCRDHPDYPAYRAATAAIVPGLPWLDWRS